MKKIISLMAVAAPLFAMGQTATDAYSVSQTDLKGTARYVSMAGAFGALGGDLSVLNQNPGGIGVYRSSDVGITLDFDNQSVYSRAEGSSNGQTQFKFSCSNAGYVGAFKLDSEIMPNVNWGFSYSRPISYNRRYSGRINNLKSSLSNYVASVTNSTGYTADELGTSSSYDPYIDSYAPWMSILSYQSFMISPTNNNNTGFKGLMGTGTTGFGEFEVEEKGGVDEFNLNFGGNLMNVLYWGFGLGISDMDYEKYTYYGEGLTNAYIVNASGQLVGGTASYGLENYLKTTGTGYNFKLGVIVKPINEFRIGLAFHTPTYWSLKDEAYAATNYEYSNQDFSNPGNKDTNAGYISETWYKIRTPWRFIASAAAIIGQKGILSFDYEYVGYNNMKVLSDNGDEYRDVTNSVNDYYKASNIFRIGAEYRVDKHVSLRLGYSYQSSPVKESAYNGQQEIMTSGTIPSYTFDKSIQYITGGIGYRYQSFYTDLALVHKYRESEYHAFSPEVGISSNGTVVYESSPTASIKDNNNQIVWSVGIRF